MKGAMAKRTIWAAAMLAAALILGCKKPKTLQGVDISPNLSNAVLPPGADGGHGYPAGITVGIAGDEKVLYAVSLNAGVWMSTNGGAWVQLGNSPPRAYSIAVDPTNPKHVVVGERDGDFKDPSKNQSGVWESFDGGGNFNKTLDPFSHNGCNGSQAIQSLVFTHQGSVIVAGTACGVAVYAGIFAGWKFPTTPIGNNLVTAVAASATKVWARDGSGTLIVTNDNGQSFHLATNQPLPNGVSFAHGGDRFSLAAFDDFAMMSTLGDDNGAGNNFDQLLIYDAKQDQWLFKKRIFDPAENVNNDPNFGSVNGTGSCECNGSRFIRAFDRQTSHGPQQSIIFSGGQDLFLATAAVLDPAKLSWMRIAGGNYTTAPSRPQYQPLVHGDFWASWLSSAGTLWLGSDGGVFENRQDGQGWRSRGDGLHTLAVQMLYAAPLNTAYATPTMDNSAWFAGFSGNWQVDDSGDSNWVVGDSGGAPLFAYAARDAQTSAVLGFDNKVPDQDLPNAGTMVEGVRRSADQSFDGPLTFNVIQTLYSGEPRPRGPTLDVVMLAKMPLQYRDDKTKQLVTVIPNQGHDVAIVRNPIWLQHPDISEGKGQGWVTLADNTPANTVGFLVAGGHSHPQLYVLTNLNGTVDLWRWDGNQKAGWKKLDISGNGQPSGLVAESLKGPVFVNPYRPERLYALTAYGVRYSINSGDTWQAEVGLTNAITGSGAYPLTASFSPNFNNVAASAHGPFGGSGTLCDMSFDEIYPDRVIAGSPFTGVFYNKGDGIWRSLRYATPKPSSPVTSVYLFGNVAVVGFQGRGLWQIQGLYIF
jgi:hypothetical protein